MYPPPFQILVLHLNVFLKPFFVQNSKALFLPIFCWGLFFWHNRNQTVWESCEKATFLLNLVESLSKSHPSPINCMYAALAIKIAQSNISCHIVLKASLAYSLGSAGLPAVPSSAHGPQIYPARMSHWQVLWNSKLFVMCEKRTKLFLTRQNMAAK